MTERRVLFEAFEAGTSDSMQAVLDDDGVHLSIESPWHGDTESGFGATLYFQLTREDATRLADALTKWLAQ